MKFEYKTLLDWSYFHAPEITDQGVIHGFMTSSSVSILHDQAQRQEFINSLSAADAIVMNQDHGDVVHVVKDGSHPTIGDGLILMEKGIIGIIKTADCLPIILSDIDHSIVAIVHAGWRGTAARISQKAVKGMRDLGANVHSIVALIGPGIGPCCYSIGSDVVTSFRQAGFADHVFEQRGQSIFLNLKIANRDALIEEGIGAIYDIDLCTSCRQDLFASSRKNAKVTRQVNFVMMNR
jgi:polyphenol oxidase